MNKDFSKYIIKNDVSVRDALVALNKLSDELTLFVLDSSNKLIGTITDGDIRRKLVEGVELSDKVEEVLHKNFSFIKDGQYIIEELKVFKEKGVKLLPCLDDNGNIKFIVNLQKKKSLLPIDAVLMAGGKGERLRPLTEKTPKPLLKLGNKSIIDYNIENLIDFGVEHINVTVNYLKEQLIEHFENPIKDINVKCVSEPQFLGTIGSIKYIKEFHNDTILLMNSDLFTNINFEEFYLHFKKNNADISVAAIPYPVSVPYGIFELNERNIVGIKEKPTYNFYANSGIYLIKREMLDLIPEGQFYNATDLLEDLIKQEKNVIRFPLVGYWIDIGKPLDYQKAQDFVKHL